MIIKDNEVVAKAYNTVIRDSDPSAHAEMNATRALINKNKLPSPSLNIKVTKGVLQQESVALFT